MKNILKIKLSIFRHIKTINILIGLKGSGKTYIGQLLQESYNIPFLRVEDICLKIKANRDVFDKEYISETFNLIEKEIRHQLQSVNELTIESTGAASEFDLMLKNLEKDFIVRPIKINTNPLICLQRVKSRDLKAHIPVSDEKVNEINKLAAQKSYNYDLVIANDDTSDEDILRGWNEMFML